MTAHNEAEKNKIAKTVIMPGDPLRAKMIAEKYLENYELVNTVRNMYAYTGTYQGKLVTVMGSGMGMPSIGIYSYELFKLYDVDRIIRVGSAGSYTKDLNLYDVLLVSDCYSDSSFAKVQNNSEENIIEANLKLNEKILNCANQLKMPITLGRVYSSDVFYKEFDNFEEIYKTYGCLACEMESFALFHNAKVLNKEAACLLTISNSFITGLETTSEERENSFYNMIELALSTLE